MQTLIHYLYTIMYVRLRNQINEKHKISTADDFLKDMQVFIMHEFLYPPWMTLDLPSSIDVSKQ